MQDNSRLKADKGDPTENSTLKHLPSAVPPAADSAQLPDAGGKRLASNHHEAVQSHIDRGLRARDQVQAARASVPPQRLPP